MVVTNISPKPILPGVPTPIAKPNLPGVPTPTTKPILPGVPTPKPILPGVPTPKSNLSGVSTPFPFMASREIAQKGASVLRLLVNLDLHLHPPALPKGRVGGPGSVHIGTYRKPLAELAAYFQAAEAKTEVDREVIASFQKALNDFMPVYTEYAGRGTHFPQEGQPEIRYVSADGQDISEAEFNATATRFEQTLARLISEFSLQTRSNSPTQLV